jgi:hypothetical protein
MKSAMLPIAPRGVAPSDPRKIESGFRLAVGPTPAALSAPTSATSFLEDFGDEPTAVEGVLTHLVAATAARDDELDELPSDHDEPTRATPVDVAAMLSIIAASGLSSPLGDTHEPPPCLVPRSVHGPYPSLAPRPLSLPPLHAAAPGLPLLAPHAIRTGYELSPPPTIRHVDSTHLDDARPPPQRLHVVLVAFVSFAITIAVVASIAMALGAPLLRR